MQKLILVVHDQDKRCWQSQRWIHVGISTEVCRKCDIGCQVYNTKYPNEIDQYRFIINPIFTIYWKKDSLQFLRWNKNLHLVNKKNEFLDEIKDFGDITSPTFWHVTGMILTLTMVTYTLTLTNKTKCDHHTFIICQE